MTDDRTDLPAEVERIKAEQHRDFTRTITPHEVIAAVCEISHVPLSEIMDCWRSDETIEARTVIVGVCRSLDKPPSFPEIGRAMGRRFHSSASWQYGRWQRFAPEERKRWEEAVLDRITQDRCRSCWLRGQDESSQHETGHPLPPHRAGRGTGR